MNQRQGVYLFADLPLQVTVIDSKGTVLGEAYMKWNGQQLEPIAQAEWDKATDGT